VAKEKETEVKKPESKPPVKKKHLHQIVTTRAHDGSFGHEHIYKDKATDHHTHPPVFAGTSQDIEDVKQHMHDHFGEELQEAKAEKAGGPGEPQEAQPAGGQPQGAAGE